jgi:hypothetical protein
MNYPRILSLDELSPYPVRRLICRNEQVRTGEVQREIVFILMCYPALSDETGLIISSNNTTSSIAFPVLFTMTFLIQPIF